ncbi:MAG: DUF6033 family protein [Butyrivibrio sp.]|nr:DUF6033 family protein [Butyrivibrio sp.]
MSSINFNGYNAYQNQNMVNSLSGRDFNDKLRNLKNENQAKEIDEAKSKAQDVYVSSNSATATSNIAEGVELSEAAKNLLEELKEKYGNMDFFVANYSSEEEAQEYLNRGTKEYSVLLDPDTLEAMAADEETKEKYMNMIDESTGKLDELKEKLAEENPDAEVTNIGMSFDSEGNVKFFAQLKKINEQNAEYAEKIKEEKAAKAEEEAKAEKKEQQEKLEEARSGKNRDIKAPTSEKTTTVKADSIDELLEAIKNVDWSTVEAKDITMPGQKFDFSV